MDGNERRCLSAADDILSSNSHSPSSFRADRASARDESWWIVEVLTGRRCGSVVRGWGVSRWGVGVSRVLLLHVFGKLAQCMMVLHKVVQNAGIYIFTADFATRQFFFLE